MEKEIKIAYIGGGSKMWAHIFMSDLSLQKGLFGEIALYDIDKEAMEQNKKLGEIINKSDNVITKWNYQIYNNVEEALQNADVVIISILPGTFEEMRSDVHTPEKYGIYQSVGDTAGPGGILRAMRTVPIYEDFAKKIKKICPNAWVVNLTNPMAICIKTLYDVFPEIKAFGCCHEVFNAQMFLATVIKETFKINKPERQEIKTNISGINHFTWMSEAYYKDIDIFSILPEFIKNNFEEGIYEKGPKEQWKYDHFAYGNKVKMDLFNKYHVLAAAGDRHLVEFMNNEWYLKDRDTIDSWHFALTTVDERIIKQNNRIADLKSVISNEKEFILKKSNEEAVELIKAVLGLNNIISNVNYPNKGQVEFLSNETIVETNCVFSNNKVEPIKAKKLPDEVEDLIRVNALNTLNLYKAIKERSLNKIFEVFINEPLCRNIKTIEAKELFKEMLLNTKEYLKDYNLEEYLKG